MTNEELEKKAKNYAEEQEKDCILGVYDDTAELEYDKGYNIGYVNGLEEGYIAGAKEMQKENEQLKAKLRTIKTCHFNGCIGCTHKDCEVKKMSI